MNKKIPSSLNLKIYEAEERNNNNMRKQNGCKLFTSLAGYSVSLNN